MHRFSAFWPAALFPVLLVTACSSGRDVTTADGALNGQGNGDALTAVESRPVWVGRNENPRADACTRRVRITEASTVYWAPVASPVTKTSAGGEVLACDAVDGWTGIIFGAAGQSLADCNLARRIAGPTEYQGPCRWGWVRNASLAR